MDNWEAIKRTWIIPKRGCLDPSSDRACSYESNNEYTLGAGRVRVCTWMWRVFDHAVLFSRSWRTHKGTVELLYVRYECWGGGGGTPTFYDSVDNKNSYPGF